MKNTALFFILFIAGTGALSQNLIGYNNNEIRKYMKENHKEMSINKVTNSRFIYLKYTNSNDNQTLLFFLNADSVCQSIRLICDRSVLPEKIKEFNSSYVRSSENRWIDKHNGKNYLIEIKDEQWSTVVTIEPDK